MTDLQIEVARKALELHIECSRITEQLEKKKDELRQLAGGKKLNIVVDGLGKIDVTEPRAGSVEPIVSIVEEKLLKSPELRQRLISIGIAKEVLVVDHAKLGEMPELKQKLMDKGIVCEEMKKVSAAKASVRIQPNV